MPSEAIEITESLVTELRGRFLCEYSTNADQFDEQDIQNIRDNDLIVRRFLEAKYGNVEEALKMMVTAMKWRKQIGVNKLDESSFPREYFQIGGIFTYGQDLNGAQLIILRVKANKKFSDWTEILKKFIVFLIERESIRFEKKENKGVCIVFDCNGAGITNVDIDLLSFIVQTLRDYYPSLLQSVVINDLPWVLQYVFKLVQTWLPKEHQKMLHLVNKKDINQYIAESELPDFMGGTNQLEYKTCPKNAPSAQEVAQKLGIKQKELDRLLNHLEPYLK